MTNINLQHVLLVGGALVLVYALMQYTNKKGSEGYVNVNTALQPASVDGSVQGQLSAQPGAQGQMGAQVLSQPPQVATAVQGDGLLPNTVEGAPGWAANVPQSGGPNLLKAGQFNGIDTVSTSLRNANLQLRSEPSITKADVGPWNSSTMESSEINNQGFVRAFGC